LQFTAFIKWNSPSLYSFQGLLPRLPVPDVRETITRYLQSIRPIFDDATYERIKQQAEEFEKGIGHKLQRYLVLKSWWSSNYVSDWWIKYAYLKGRNSLMANSNIYGMDSIGHPTKSQSARAANIIYLLMQYRKKLEKQQLPPIMAQGIVPLCSWQYEKMFNTTRIPGIESDQIIHCEDSKHIAVHHRGRFFKMAFYDKKRYLKPIEMQQQIEEILQSKALPVTGEENLASLTAWNRTKWAEARNKFFASGINKESLDTIESAAFVLALDDEPYGISFDSEPEMLDVYAKALLHGSGSNRWFDKSFTVCVSSNGRFGMNAEHSWGDAVVSVHVFEEFIYDDLMR